MKQQVDMELYKYKTIKKTGKTIVFTCLGIAITVIFLFLLCFPVVYFESVNKFLIDKCGKGLLDAFWVFTLVFSVGHNIFLIVFAIMGAHSVEWKEENCDYFFIFIFFINLWYMIMFNFSIYLPWLIMFNITCGLYLIISSIFLLINFNDFLTGKIKKLEEEKRKITNQKIDEIRLREMGYGN
jgi:hypothetical protein